VRGLKELATARKALSIGEARLNSCANLRRVLFDTGIAWDKRPITGRVALEYRYPGPKFSRTMQFAPLWQTVWGFQGVGYLAAIAAEFGAMKIEKL